MDKTAVLVGVRSNNTQHEYRLLTNRMSFAITRNVLQNRNTKDGICYGDHLG